MQTQQSSSLDRPLRILIADDHEVVRAGIRAILLLRLDVEVIEASNGQEAIDQARKTKPDLIILDVTMPVLGGVQAARRLKQEMPKIPILMLSMHEGRQLTHELRAIGVQGYVSKTDAVTTLPEAIDALFGGGTFFETKRP